MLQMDTVAQDRCEHEYQNQLELQGELIEMEAECNYPHWNLSRTSELMIQKKKSHGNLNGK